MLDTEVPLNRNRWHLSQPIDAHATVKSFILQGRPYAIEKKGLLGMCITSAPSLKRVYKLCNNSNSKLQKIYAAAR